MPRTGPSLAITSSARRDMSQDWGSLNGKVRQWRAQGNHWDELIGPEPEFASWAAICDGMKWPPAGSSLLTSRFGASSRHFSLLQKRILSMKRHRDEHDLGERWSWTHDEFDLLRNRTDSGPITT